MKTKLKVGKTEVEVSNLDKVFYPKTGFTKGEVLDYYINISSVLLPHLKDRPISLKRYPDGVEGFFFYEKNCPAHRPDWVKTAPVEKEAGGEINYCLMNDLPTLVWAVNLADLELHTFQHRARALTRPTALVFDLDPGPPADIVSCCRVALWLKEALDGMGLESFPKTSGSKGLQICVPLNTAVTYARTKEFAKAAAQSLEARHPREVVSRMEKRLRKGKVFIDWSQNDDSKTTVTVYSLRAKDSPMVSTPVTWAEVKAALKAKRKLAFDSAQVLNRVSAKGDLFAPVLEKKQKLPKWREVEKKEPAGGKRAAG